METKYMTKAKLVTVNNRAKKAGGRHIDPDFVALLPDRFKFPVVQLPFGIEKGWIRCWVTVGPDDPIISENVRTLLMDIRYEAFDKLPSLSETAAAQE